MGCEEKGNVSDLALIHKRLIFRMYFINTIRDGGCMPTILVSESEFSEFVNFQNSVYSKILKILIQTVLPVLPDIQSLINRTKGAGCLAGFFSNPAFCILRISNPV